jgi:hypothetical protein
MAIHLDAATEKRFQETLREAESRDESALMNHLLDLEQDYQARLAAFRSELNEAIIESREQFARGEFVTEEQLRAKLDARRQSKRQRSAA